MRFLLRAASRSHRLLNTLTGGVAGAVCLFLALPAVADSGVGGTATAAPPPGPTLESPAATAEVPAPGAPAPAGPAAAPEAGATAPSPAVVLPAAAQPSRAAVTPDRDQAFLDARAAFQSGDETRLNALVPALGDHILHDYPAYWVAQLHLRAYPADDAPVSAFLEQHADSVLADRLRGEWILALARRGEWKRVLEQRRLWVSNGDDAQILCAEQLARYALDDGADLAQIVVQARRHLADTADPGAETCTALANRLLDDGAMPVVARLQALIERKAFAEAEHVAHREGDAWAAQFKRMLARPDNWLHHHADRPSPGDEGLSRLVRLAIVALARDNPEEAARRAQDWDAVWDDSDRGVIWGRVARSGSHELLAQASQWFARGGDRLGVGIDYVRAEDTLESRARAALRQGSTQAAADAGMAAQPDWEDLRLTIEQMPPAMRDRDNWRYWYARALAAQGDAVLSQALLASLAGRFSYYGRLAAEELGQAFVLPPAPPAPDAARIDAIAARPGVARAFRLYALGLRDDGRREWAWETRSMGDADLLAAAAAAQREGLLDRAIYASERTRALVDLGQRYPMPYADLLQSICAPLAIDPAWVYGLVRQESRFMQDIRSHAGAIGLMQIMPATARYVARRIGLAGFSRESMTEVPVNLRLGTEYLRMVSDDQDSRSLLASAAYNAGPQRVRRWRAALARPLDARIFVETIPIDETRDYVEKVLFNASIYGNLMQGGSVSLHAALDPITPKAVPLHSDLP